MDEQEINRPDEQAPDSQDEMNTPPGAYRAGDSGAHLDWIEESLLRTPVEELPTLHWPENEAIDSAAKQSDEDAVAAGGGKVRGAGSLRDVADAMAWLEEMAQGRGAPIDAMPTLVTSLPNEEPPTPAPASKPSPVAKTPPGETDSDPMAWLEQLAVGQVSPLEELPSVADRLLASEIVSQLDEMQGQKGGRVYSAVHGPEQVEQALTYLEQLAAAQGVDWSNVPLDLSQPVGSLEEALAVIDRIAMLAASSAKVDVPSRAELPPKVLAEQATQVSLDVLEREELEAEMLTQEEIEVAPPTVQFTDAQRGKTAVALDEVEEAWDDLSARMPDDPQEALRWLTTIAEEELSSGVMIVEEDTLPPQEVQEKQASAQEQRAGPAAGKTPEPVVDETSGVDFALDEMPDDPDEAMAWMRRLAASQPQQIIPRAGAVLEPAAPPEVELEPPVTIVADESVPEVPAPMLHPLLTARKALRKGDLPTTVALYKALLQQSDDLALLIPDLEEAVDIFGPDARLIPLLGDAYAQTGQLQKAVETYRRGFDQT
jgi:tetratricopeptide (TPR) repeat protein